MLLSSSLERVRRERAMGASFDESFCDNKERMGWWGEGGGGKAKESVCLDHLFFRPHKTPHTLALPTDLPRCSCGVAGQVGDFLMNKNK